jgi:hypothetical protein
LSKGWRSTHWYTKRFISKLIKVREINVEYLFVLFLVGSSKFLINAAYFPPLSPSVLYEHFMSIFETIYYDLPEHTFLLCGDYILPDISWSNDSHGLIYTLSSPIRVSCFPESLALNRFYQQFHFKLQGLHSWSYLL